METVRDLPAAFQGLPPGYGMVELKTMHARDQVTRQSIITARVLSQQWIGKWLSLRFLLSQENLDELKLVVGDSFENVASLQGCHFQQRDSVQTLGKVLTVGGNAYRDGQMFPWKTTVSVCHSDFEGRLRESPTSALSLANNSPFLLGVNTKQLSNQMLDLTKVINELKEVLIQQVTAAQTVPLRPL